MQAFGGHFWVCFTIVTFFFSRSPDKDMNCFKNELKSFWQAKVENKASKGCLPPALLEVKLIFSS